jgi:hypothetical protein
LTFYLGKSKGIDPTLMLEPTTPAGEPFETQGQDENKSTQDFEEVCTSLVERGWKIMPKKGTYPINKQGPRYINLVDPRGNRKSVRVMDSSLWEKLRVIESTRSRKKNSSKSKKGIDEKQEKSVDDSVDTQTNIPNQTITSELEPLNVPIIRDSPQINETDFGLIPNESSIQSQTNQIQEPNQLQSKNPESPENITAESSPPQVSEETIAKVFENSTEALQSFAKSRPALQKSIFELGLDSLIAALQSKTLGPQEIIQKIQDWTDNSKNLIEFVHKWNESRELPINENMSEKDSLIVELQATLKETEDKLAALIHSAREI